MTGQKWYTGRILRRVETLPSGPESTPAFLGVES